MTITIFGVSAPMGRGAEATLLEESMAVPEPAIRALEISGSR